MKVTAGRVKEKRRARTGVPGEEKAGGNDESTS